ncbi:MAG: hypothetical protein Fur0039_26080 [Rhodocyclaceae bacterium]
MSASLATQRNARVAPAAIGRFAVERELGRGRQGAVYLGRDPQLQRRVAIKTLHGGTGPSSSGIDRLMAEARLVSALQHPNIVSLYEAGEHEGRPYLVFEYVEGETLASHIRRAEAPDIPRAVIWMSQLAAGLAHAHARGVLHLDLKPENILIGSDGIPKLADFGIGRMLWAPGGESSRLPGTVCYMCPERFANAPPAPGWDVFALGLIFREMLTGRFTLEDESDIAAIYRIVNEIIPLPSTINPHIDERIDAVVAKALQKDPARRYRDAGEMKAALDRLRVPAGGERLATPDEIHVDATVEFLLRRMQHKGDFPVLSRNLSRITRIAARSEASTRELANEVLKDLALTKRLLGIANSAFYGNAGANVTSIYQAILVMGLDQVRLAVGSLLCTAHLQGGPNARVLREIALGSFAGAMLAKAIASHTGSAREEEAFICASFRHLGESLVVNYLPEEYEAIQARIAAGGAHDEAVASREILGIAYHRLGQGVARAWKLPERLVATMAPYPDGMAAGADDDEDALCECVSLADEICQAISRAPAGGGGEALEAIAERHAKGMNLSARTLAGLIAPADAMARKYAALLGIGTQGAEFIRRLDEWHARAGAPEAAGTDGRATDGAAAGEAAHEVAQETQGGAPPAARPVSRLRAWLGAIWG